MGTKKKAKAPLPPAQPASDPKGPLLGHLHEDERRLWREVQARLRKAQRYAQRAQSVMEDAVDGFKESHPEIIWKEASAIDDDTGEIRGKVPEPKKA